MAVNLKKIKNYCKFKIINKLGTYWKFLKKYKMVGQKNAQNGKIRKKIRFFFYELNKIT